MYLKDQKDAGFIVNGYIKELLINVLVINLIGYTKLITTISYV